MSLPRTLPQAPLINVEQQKHTATSFVERQHSNVKSFCDQ